MRKFSGLLALAVTALLLAGCYYDFPLTSRPTKDLNTWLLGVWETKGDEGEVFRAEFFPLTGDRYTVWFHELGTRKKPKKSYQFEGWISRVGSSSFLNLKCLESPGDVPPGKFMFFHYQLLNQNTLRTRALKLDVAQETTSYQLRIEIRRKLKEKSLYPEESVTWRRISEVYWDTQGVEQPFQPLRNPTL